MDATELATNDLFIGVATRGNYPSVGDEGLLHAFPTRRTVDCRVMAIVVLTTGGAIFGTRSSIGRVATAVGPSLRLDRVNTRPWHRMRCIPCEMTHSC
jgi:hypothetical protein